MSGKVLLVDDSSSDRQIIRRILEARLPGVEIIEARHGVEAIQLLKSEGPEVVILDLVMPEKDGYQVLTEVREEPFIKDIPIIICSVLDDLSNIERALELGALDYFMKPLAKDVMRISLPLKVKNAIELRKRRVAIERLSNHDSLTGLYNRRAFEAHLARLDVADSLPLSIVMGDVNGLKITNDIFGHQAGDRVLRQIAHTLLECVQADDIVSRWGGDEFVLLLPRTAERAAHELCEGIRRACEPEIEALGSISVALGYATKLYVEQDIYKVLRDAEDFMYRNKLLERRSYRSSMVSSLKNTLEEKSHETVGHTERMTELSRLMGIKMDLSDSELDSLRLLAMMHDIGKVAIEDSILKKPGALNDEEWKEIKRHPEIGFRIAQSSADLASVADYILSHHERWDGKGYPQGLKEEDIPLLSRIITIIDAYDCMTNDRPYRPSIGWQEALEEIQRCSEAQFDPELAVVFTELIREMQLGDS